jgi:hypothetical protein
MHLLSQVALYPLTLKRFMVQSFYASHINEERFDLEDETRPSQILLKKVVLAHFTSLAPSRVAGLFLKGTTPSTMTILVLSSSRTDTRLFLFSEVKLRHNLFV